jgi:hypothetical protein
MFFFYFLQFITNVIPAPFRKYVPNTNSQDGVVSTTKLRMHWMSWGLNSCKGNRFFLSPKCPDWLWATPSLYSMDTRDSSPRSKACGTWCWLLCVRCDTKWHTTKICRYQCPFGGISSSAYQTKSQRNYVLNSTLPLNYSWKNNHWNPLNRGWVGPCTSLDILK